MLLINIQIDGNVGLLQKPSSFSPKKAQILHNYNYKIHKL